MNFTQSFKLAIKSLLLSKMRALLTMLGIIIGVAAVIIITSLGNGMQNYMNAQFEQLGSNLIQVMVYGRGEGGTRDVSTEDMYALVEKYPQYLSGVTPYVSATAKVRQGTEDFDRTSIYGVSEAFYRADTQKTMQGSSLENGRFLRYIDVERHQNVCVIGSYLAENAFRTDPLGQTISVSGVPYMVVGVLAESGDSTEGSVDDVIYIPYANAQRLGGGSDLRRHRRRHGRGPTLGLLSRHRGEPRSGRVHGCPGKQTVERSCLFHSRCRGDPGGGGLRAGEYPEVDEGIGERAGPLRLRGGDGLPRRLRRRRRPAHPRRRGVGREAGRCPVEAGSEGHHPVFPRESGDSVSLPRVPGASAGKEVPPPAPYRSYNMGGCGKRYMVGL